MALAGVATDQNVINLIRGAVHDGPAMMISGHAGVAVTLARWIHGPSAKGNKVGIRMPATPRLDGAGDTENTSRPWWQAHRDLISRGDALRSEKPTHWNGFQSL